MRQGTRGACGQQGWDKVTTTAQCDNQQSKCAGTLNPDHLLLIFFIIDHLLLIPGYEVEEQ